MGRKRRAEASMDSLAEPRRVRRDRSQKRTAETSISFQDDDYCMQHVKRTKGERRSKREPSHSTTEGQASIDGENSEGSVSGRTRRRTKSSSSKKDRNSKTRSSKKKKKKKKKNKSK